MFWPRIIAFILSFDGSTKLIIKELKLLNYESIDGRILIEIKWQYSSLHVFKLSIYKTWDKT